MFWLWMVVRKFKLEGHWRDVFAVDYFGRFRASAHVRVRVTIDIGLISIYFLLPAFFQVCHCIFKLEICKNAKKAINFF
jgi:hypothetical protein